MGRELIDAVQPWLHPAATTAIKSRYKTVAVTTQHSTDIGLQCSGVSTGQLR